MRARTAAENPRLAHGPAPHPPPSAAGTSTFRPLKWRTFRCGGRGCEASVSLAEYEMLPPGWHVTADQHHPRYTCGRCAGGVAPGVVADPGGTIDAGPTLAQLAEQAADWDELAAMEAILGNGERAADYRARAAGVRARMGEGR